MLLSLPRVRIAQRKVKVRRGSYRVIFLRAGAGGRCPSVLEGALFRRGCQFGDVLSFLRLGSVLTSDYRLWNRVVGT